MIPRKRSSVNVHLIVRSTLNAKAFGFADYDVKWSLRHTLVYILHYNAINAQRHTLK